MTPTTLSTESASALKRRYYALPSTAIDAHLKVHCGCGWSSPSISDGLEHSRTTSHILHITGEIRPTT